MSTSFRYLGRLQCCLFILLPSISLDLAKHVSFPQNYFQHVREPAHFEDVTTAYSTMQLLHFLTLVTLVAGAVVDTREPADGPGSLLVSKPLRILFSQLYS